MPGQPSEVNLGKCLNQSDILGNSCYTGKTVGISSMRDSTYWRQWLRSSLASLSDALYLIDLYRSFKWTMCLRLPFHNTDKGE